MNAYKLANILKFCYGFVTFKGRMSSCLSKLPSELGFICLTLLLLTSGCASLSPDSVDENQCKIQDFIFNYPSNFIIAELKKTSSEPDLDYLYKAIVLVEKDLNLPNETLEAFELGSHPAILVFIKKYDLDGDECLVRFDKLAKAGLVEKIKINDHFVYKYPHHPGMYGKNIFYYIIPISANEVLCFTGNKKREVKNEWKDTNYNLVIEGIIKSLRKVNY